MKCSKALIAAVLYFLPLFNYAQSKGIEITGSIIDETQTPVEGAVVSLVRVKDSSLVKVQATDRDGRFGYEGIKQDLYFIQVTHAGYQQYSGTAFTTTDGGPDIHLPSLVLTKAEKQLTGVTVQAKTPFVEHKIDRTVVNVNALISNAGNNLLEVLQKSPGIAVDENGGIKLKGKGGVVIYIDDKPTYLSEADLANYLRSIPAGAVDIIEIMTNPPARYDAAGNAGVINIKLKKTKARGLNGGIVISYGQGLYFRNNNSLNFNYRVNKINFFTNLSENINNTYQDLYLSRGYYQTTGKLSSAFKQNSFIKKQPTGFNLKLGADYYLNAKSTFGIVFSGFTNAEKKTVTNNASITDSSDAVQNIVRAKAISKRTLNNKGVNLNYSYKPDSTGREWLFTADYLKYNARLNSSLLNSLYSADENFISSTNLIGRLPSSIQIATGKGDYSVPYKNGIRLDAGVKASFINTNNIADFFDENNNELVPNNDFSNNFRYTENINAAYISISADKKRLSLQGGLRFENTNLSGHQAGNTVRPDSSFQRTINSLFPTFYASYKLDTNDRNQLAFSFGRRIDRPDYQSMNPFTYPLDRYTLYGGNPYLRPTFSNNFELSHIWKNRVTTTFQYSYISDVIAETIEQSNTIFYSRPGNYGKQISYGISINASVNPAKWWTVQLYTELIKNKFTAKLYNLNLDNTGTYFAVNASNLFILSAKWNAELSGAWQSKVYYGQFVTIPYGSATAAVSRKIFKDKGTIKAGLSDIFYTSQRGGEIKSLLNSTASWHSYFDSRVMTFSFSYRFSKGKTLKARENDAAESEKGRVKIG